MPGCAPHTDVFWNASWKQSSQQHSASHVPVEHYKKDKTYEGNEEIHFYQRQIIRKLHPQLPSIRGYKVPVWEKQPLISTYLHLTLLKVQLKKKKQPLFQIYSESDKESYFRQRHLIVETQNARTTPSIFCCLKCEVSFLKASTSTFPSFCRKVMKPSILNEGTLSSGKVPSDLCHLKCQGHCQIKVGNNVVCNF